MDTNKHNSAHRYCVIMCGGIGSRFWPKSRQERPKQFLDFLGTGRSLLQMTFDRIARIVPVRNIIVVTNSGYAPLVAEQLPQLAQNQILLEPARRNTAPCVAWAAYHIAARDPEATIIVTPSDHLITREREFEEAILRAFGFAERHDALLTLGVTPSRPETGYGYIQIGEPIECVSPGDCICRVKTFTEKPDLELAKVFVESGEFFWNSGIFIWRAQTIIDAFHEVAPEIADLFDKGKDSYGTPAENEFIKKNFPGCMSVSIDYAVMEKAKNVYVMVVNFGWSDLGTWSALYDLSPKNSKGNVTQQCRVLSYDTSGCIFAVDGKEKLIAVDGLKDYIVVDASDVLLICPKSREQQIKQIVHDAQVNFGEKYL